MLRESTYVSYLRISRFQFGSYLRGVTNGSATSRDYFSDHLLQVFLELLNRDSRVFLLIVMPKLYRGVRCQPSSLIGN